MEEKKIITGIVKSATGIKEFNGKKNIGFMLEEIPKKWFNITSEEDESLQAFLEMGIISKGNEIKFEVEGNEANNVTLLNKAKKTQDKQAQNSGSDEMTNFEELLKVAHSKGLLEITTQMISIDFENKTAVFKAKVVMAAKITKKSEVYTERERIFEAYVDATQENCGDLVKKHWIRMAETRSIVRALRFATNNAKVSKEET